MGKYKEDIMKSVYLIKREFLKDVTDPETCVEVHCAQ